MPLPDISGLLRITSEQWRAISDRLRSIGLSQQYAASLQRLGGRPWQAPQKPLLVWNLNQQDSLSAKAFTLLMANLPIRQNDARSVFGHALTDLLYDCGFLTTDEQGWVISNFDLRMIADYYVICDHLFHGGDAVMGPGSTTGVLCRLSASVDQVDLALDLGCGAGSNALALSPIANKVIATDINPRAVSLTKINLQLNDVRNVEVRESNLFDLVRGIKFDLIVHQPPFVPTSKAMYAAVFLNGGERGDGILSQVLFQIPEYLSTNGLALVLTDLPVFDESPIEYLRRTVGPGADALLLICPAMDMDEYCVRYSSVECAMQIEEYDKRVTGRREHLEKIGLKSLHPALIVVQKRCSGTEWRDSVIAPISSWQRISGGSIRTMLAVRDLLAEGLDALLASPLNFAPGLTALKAVYSSETTTTIVLMPPYDMLSEPTEINLPQWELLQVIAEAPKLLTAIQGYAERIQGSADAILKDNINLLARLLYLGVLIPARGACGGQSTNGHKEENAFGDDRKSSFIRANNKL